MIAGFNAVVLTLEEAKALLRAVARSGDFKGIDWIRLAKLDATEAVNNLQGFIKQAQYVQGKLHE